MTYLFTCPHCQAKTEVEDQYSGQSGECFSCGSPIQLPDFASQGGQGKQNASSGRPVGVMIAAGVVLTLLFCLVAAIVRFGGSSVSRLAEVRLQKSSISNLEAIASALNAYAADYGTYPPAVTRDDNGRSLHSWRVLILPYLGEQAIYDEFDLDKAWNHETNLQASYTMPDVYRHPTDSNPAAGKSGYYLITGPGTLFPKSGPASPTSITDNPAQTILVIAGSAPITIGMGGWAEPVDLDFSRMQGVVNGTFGVEPGGLLTSGVTMATVDGRGHLLPVDTPPATFNALVTPNGGEPLPDDTLD